MGGGGPYARSRRMRSSWIHYPIVARPWRLTLYSLSSPPYSTHQSGMGINLVAQVPPWPMGGEGKDRRSPANVAKRLKSVGPDVGGGGGEHHYESMRIGSPPWERKSVGEGEGATRALLGIRRSRPEGIALLPRPGKRSSARSFAVPPTEIHCCTIGQCPAPPAPLPTRASLESVALPPPVDSVTRRGEEAA